MKKSLLSFFSVSTLTLTGCITGCSYHVKPLSEQLSEIQKHQFAEVYEYAVKSPRVSFIVKSHGCTLAEDFELKQSSGKHGKLEIALIRLKKDRCRAMPRAFPVSFPLINSEATMVDVVLLNPIEESQSLLRHGKIKRPNHP